MSKKNLIIVLTCDIGRGNAHSDVSLQWPDYDFKINYQSKVLTHAILFYRDTFSHCRYILTTSNL